MLSFRPRSVTRQIIIHASHTGTEVGPLVPHLRVLGRRNGLLDIGYHFVIERDGFWECTRDHQTIGSHAPGNNHDSIGICLANNDGEDPTEPALWTLRSIVDHLCALYGPLSIMGHSEVKPRRVRGAPCPGFDMDRFREDIESLNGYTESRSRPGAKEGGDDDRQLYSTDGGGGGPTTMADTGSQSVSFGGAALSEQNKIILEYLRSGRTLTNLIALTNLGIGSLTSRIAELRQMGHRITSTPDIDYHKRRYIKYALETKPSD